MKCPYCNSEDYIEKGYVYLKNNKIKRWKCNICNKRYSEHTKVKEKKDYTFEVILKENRQLKEKLTKQNTAFKIIDSLLDEKIKNKILPSIKPALPIKIKKHNDLMCALFSDLQYGQVVEPSFTSNIGCFNPDIAKQRITLWADKIINFKKADENYHTLNELILMNLGDNLENYTIYEGQKFNVIGDIIDSLYELALFLADAKRRFCSYFPIVREFKVSGNHGRIGKKGDYSERDNLDYLLYRTENLMLQQQKNYIGFISKCPIMMLRLGNFDWFITHGHQVKRYMSIPYYGLERFYRNVNVMANKIFRYGVVPHSHGSFQAVRLIMNGTFVGGSDLSINNMAEISESVQKTFIYNNEHGIHRTTDLYLSEPLNLKLDKENIYTDWI